ncbi:DUF4932 domain-containing protein [Spirosoma sp. KNUC1025]|uniref:DUF4932 domain-containing protein n=1 Tax=Spirosoma sp. KNUC1025 TaxID=2894082 RepID=UPI003867ECBD|nr:DUF4932 domain-containing protein [Spirosoma sp. KNUC1025]
MKILVGLLLFGTLSSFSVAQKQIQVDANRNVELINMLAVQNSAGLLKDTLTNAWYKENSVLMRISFHRFRQVQQLPIYRTYQLLEDRLGTGTYLLSLYYSEVPEAKRRTDLPNVLTEAVSQNRDSVLNAIDTFFTELNSLYKAIHFDRFLSDNEAVYRQALVEVSRNLPAATFIPTMESYYGETKNGYHLLINPFFQTGWGMGWEVISRTGTDIFNISSPLSKAIRGKDGRISSPGFDNREGVRRLAVHEFGHSFVNPLANQPAYKAQIEQFNILYEPIKGDEQYHDWHTQFCEYVVRAGEIRLALRMHNTADAKAVEQQNSNWRYLAHFTSQLERYEQNRKLYPTFSAFFPTLIASLSSLKK